MKPKVLIIDDGVEYRSLLAQYLNGAGYFVDTCDAFEGAGKAGARRPDIILLDVMMPVHSGIEVLRELQGQEETGNIPVLVMTGGYFDEGIGEFFRQESNCADFAPKSADLASLAARIAKILRLPARVSWENAG